MARASGLAARLRRFQTPTRLKAYDRLHLGSGARLLDGWANIDIEGGGALVWDLRKPLPISRRQIRFVYTEHFIEHITRPVRGSARQTGACRAGSGPSSVAIQKLLDLEGEKNPDLQGVLQIGVGDGFRTRQTGFVQLTDGVRFVGASY
jgi:hypothetical protein